MHADFLHALRTLVVAASVSAVLLAPPPARAQRVDVCALVACGASGQRAAAFAEPARMRPAAPPSAVSSSALPTSTAPAAPMRDPWARHFQGRETDDDACLLNFGLNGQLARKGTFDTHVLGRTQTWRGPQR